VLIYRRANSRDQFNVITRFVQELSLVTWDGYDNYGKYTGLASLTLTNYPILRSFSFTCGNLNYGDYQWTSFESLSIHDLPLLETIYIGIKTIPDTKNLRISSKIFNIAYIYRFTKITID